MYRKKISTANMFKSEYETEVAKFASSYDTSDGEVVEDFYGGEY